MLLAQGATAPAESKALRNARTTGKVLHIYVLTGQSNALGQNATNDDPIATTPLYPDHALMFDGGPWLSGEFGNVVPLVERDRGDQSATKASSAINHLIRDVEAMGKKRPFVLAIVVAEGGVPLSAIAPPSAIVTQIDKAVRAGCAFAKANGLRPEVLAIDLVQGESDDVGNSSSRYAKSDYDPQRRVLEVKAFAQTMSRRLMAITGQRKIPAFLMQQVYSTAFADPALQYRHFINESYRRLHDVDNCRLSGPCYIGPSTAIPGDIHFNSEGQNRMGQQTSRALLAAYLNTKSYPCTLKSVRFVAPTRIRIEVETERYPIVADTSGTIVLPTEYVDNLGFYVADLDNSDIPLGARVIGAHSVELTLARIPRGERVKIAYGHKPREQAAWGPFAGAAGLIRDSAAHLNCYTGHTQANWLAAFNVRVATFTGSDKAS